jgi:cytidylate kinase
MAVLTISRQFGAGGKTLAQLVSKALDYPLADEEIIERLAETAQTTPDGIQRFEAEEDAHQRQAREAAASRHFIERIFDTKRNYMDGQRYVELLREIIPQIARKGNLIILGRGAQFILKDYGDDYHVLLVAEEVERIRFIQEHYALDAHEARQAVIKQGKRRQKLMKLFNREDCDQPLHYDLVLNMSKTRMETAVDLVCALVSAPAAQ